MNTLPFTIHDLLAGNAPSWADDKFFWYAQTISLEHNRICITASRKNSITAFAEYAEEYNIPSISELSKIRHGQYSTNTLGPALVSSGSLLIINDMLAITKRTPDAKVDPDKWTTPAGRCDRTPLVTGIKETIEEIEISAKDGTILLPDMARDLIHSRPNTDFYTTSTCGIETTNIEFYVGPQLIETAHMWSYFSQASNTLELRLPIIARLDEPISLSNPEFNTPAKLVDPHTLNPEEVVPALRHFLHNLAPP